MPQRRQTIEVIALILLFAGITAFTIVGFARAWSPPVASVHGEGVDSVIHYLLYTTGTVLLLAAGAFLFFLWRYGSRKTDLAPVASRRAERLWSFGPVLGMALIAEAGVMFKGLPVWQAVYGPAPPGALEVEVTGQQFEWIVRYPGPDGQFGKVKPEFVDQTSNPAGLDSADAAGHDDIVLRKALHLVAGRPTHVRLRARDVLHSFTIPAFRVKLDAVPGMVGGLNFTPNRTGEFEIACAELCGMGHYRMSGRALVHTQEEFDAWLTSLTAEAQP